MYVWRAKTRAQCTYGSIQRRIDGKGKVIFTLKSGGIIRDTGKKVFFSLHDEEAKELAARYAALKWGKAVAQEENRLCRNPQREQVREVERQMRKGLSRQAKHQGGFRPAPKPTLQLFTIQYQNSHRSWTLQLTP